MKKLSIIIPVYNVEKYVGRCLESCLEQDLPKDEYEIIVVNDGTKDNSVQVIEKYITPENNVTLIHRENGGLSAARNTGLKYAQGEYVWFVDSDDWIEKNALAKLLFELDNNKLDVLCINRFQYYTDGTKKSRNINYVPGKIMRGRDFISIKGISPGAWCALYRKSFLMKYRLYFKEGILHEDQEFTPRVFYLANRISFIDFCAYFYFQRDGSIMRSSQNAKRCKDLLIVADSLFNFAETKCKQHKDAYSIFLEKVTAMVLQSAAYYNTDYFPISEYKKYPFYPLRVEVSTNKSMFLKCMLFNLSPKLYIIVYKLIKRK